LYLVQNMDHSLEQCPQSLSNRRGQPDFFVMNH